MSVANGDFPLSSAEIDHFIDTAFAEDIGAGDVTCETVIPEGAILSATMNAREDMVIAGLPLMTPIFKRLDPDCTIETFAEDGERLSPGSKIMTISGKARALLSAERTALNTLQHLSGIATLTRQYVDVIEGTNARLLDTRKTIPGLRMLGKYATKMGGAKNHRIGLFDAVMIKDNHIAVAGSVEKAILGAKAAGRRDIQVECDTLSQVSDALKFGANSLLLDNMPPETLRQALEIVGGKIPCEASGGVNLQTIRAIAETGINFISVGRLTQSAPAVDIGLDYGG
ncbi:carboxylating nicotinate-nucleotide diphosphorylase [Kordiimonas sp. SCSIO 12610]|uniref:carboxylating nicotinate-nucleotide diphosphorylase n=1 Tax=Kordiimonas sp. SCSIO 12610 TaxID=2829597 RepID=UPI00210D2118|nr:carboxylating nicotinate-nucleotide diphosphorylase [Kordiimonas sp. SCSIO 12610]UTW56435.1 carboxylating nicotinate-nucleotide diphosphorylase [Kordiimonas sp. SCSIO 12610]